MSLVGRSLGGRSALLDRSRRELGLLFDILDDVIHVNTGNMVPDGEGSDDGHYEDEGHETPGHLLEDVGGLPNSKSLIG